MPKILNIDLYTSDDPGQEGTVKGATFRIADLTLRCIDSPDVHSFGFTPSVSFFFDCQDDETFNELFDRLSSEGSVLCSGSALSES